MLHYRNNQNDVGFLWQTITRLNFLLLMISSERHLKNSIVYNLPKLVVKFWLCFLRHFSQYHPKYTIYCCSERSCCSCCSIMRCCSMQCFSMIMCCCWYCIFLSCVSSCWSFSSSICCCLCHYIIYIASSCTISLKDFYMTPPFSIPLNVLTNLR